MFTMQRIGIGMPLKMSTVRSIMKKILKQHTQKQYAIPRVGMAVRLSEQRILVRLMLQSMYMARS